MRVLAGPTVRNVIISPLCFCETLFYFFVGFASFGIEVSVIALCLLSLESSLSGQSNPLTSFSEVKNYFSLKLISSKLGSNSSSGY